MVKLIRSGAVLFSILMLASSASAAGRTAEAILADYDAVKAPALDRSKVSDKEYVATYRKEAIAAETKKSELAKELLEADPANGRLPKLMGARWNFKMQMGQEGVEAEVDAVIAENKAPGLVKVARSVKGSVLLEKASEEGDAAKKLAQLKQIVTDYPGSQAAAGAEVMIRQAEAVGKHFDLKFNDAITGKEITTESLKGKVVVVDFWATWCGPCVAEMPNNKEIYAKYKDKGVEFVGISLDQPEETGKGLTKLKAFVAEHDIQWPQYYQGNYWQSEFSKSWGINSIPCVFILDANGNLYSTQARGQLEKLIPELIAKRDGK